MKGAQLQAKSCEGSQRRAFALGFALFILAPRAPPAAVRVSSGVFAPLTPSGPHFVRSFAALWSYNKPWLAAIP